MAESPVSDVSNENAELVKVQLATEFIGILTTVAKMSL